MAGMLDGKVALVTGGGGGIGRATALALGARGGARRGRRFRCRRGARHDGGVRHRRWRQHRCRAAVTGSRSWTAQLTFLKAVRV